MVVGGIALRRSLSPDCTFREVKEIVAGCGLALFTISAFVHDARSPKTTKERISSVEQVHGGSFHLGESSCLHFIGVGLIHERKFEKSNNRLGY